jgi:hypothetical protein
MKSSRRLLRTAIVLLSLALCAGAVNELFTKRAILSERLGHLSPAYWLALAAIVGILAFFLLSILSITELTAQTGGFRRKVRSAALKRRTGLGKLRWPAVFVAAIIRAALVIRAWDALRRAVFRTILWVAPACSHVPAQPQPDRFHLMSLGFGAVLVAGLYYLAAKLTMRTTPSR